MRRVQVQCYYVIWNPDGTFGPIGVTSGLEPGVHGSTYVAPVWSLPSPTPATVVKSALENGRIHRALSRGWVGSCSPTHPHTST